LLPFLFLIHVHLNKLYLGINHIDVALVIDKNIAKRYGFTEEELDFIINYDIKYRMGDELNDSE
jgi:hypothetical protein